MKFLIIGDLRGNVPEIYFEDFDAIIAPGDFCSDAPRKYMFQALKLNLENPKSKIQWYDLAGKKNAKEMIKKSVQDGRKILEKLNGIGVPVYVVPGNWDYAESNKTGWKEANKVYWKSLKKGLKNIIDVHQKIINIGDYQIIGHGITSGPEYPQQELKNYTKSELKIKKIEYLKMYKKIDLLFSKAKKLVIFMPHNVPYNTPLVKIVNPASPRNGQHFGSLIARQMIDRYHPLVCIGGHMHEHFRSYKMGKTTAINAGFGSYVNVLLEIYGNKIRRLEFHKGKKHKH